MVEAQIVLSTEKLVINSLLLLGLLSYEYPKDMKFSLDSDIFKK